MLICPSGRLVALARDEMSLRATVNYLYRLDDIENNDEAASADVRFDTHDGLKSGIARGLKSAQ